MGIIPDSELGNRDTEIGAVEIKDGATDQRAGVDSSGNLKQKEQGAIGWEANPYSTDFGTAEGLKAVSEMETVRQRLARKGLMKYAAASGLTIINAMTLTALMTNITVTAGKTAYIYDIYAAMNSATATPGTDYFRLTVNGVTLMVHPVTIGQLIHIKVDGGISCPAGGAIAVQGYLGAAGKGNALVVYSEVTA